METYNNGLSNQELKASIFWVKNEVTLFKIFRIAIYALNILVWSYVVWGLLDAYVISYPRESKFTFEIAQNQLLLTKLTTNKPQNISTSQVLVFNNTDNRKDIMVDIRNSNTDWWAEFDYHFNVSGEETTKKHEFILPQDQFTLTELGFNPKTKGAQRAQLIIDNLRWHRIDPEQVNGNYKNFIKERFSHVLIKNISFKNSLVGPKNQGVSSFDIVNNTAYGFWSIDYVIKLKRGSTVVAVNKINIKDLKPGDIRHIELNWFEPLSAITKTEIIPHINLLDPNSYLTPDRF